MSDVQIENVVADEILAAKYEWDNCGVAYARYSTHSQTEQSIEGQLRDIFEYAKRERIKIIHIYIDRALSGKYDDRPEFQQMVADSKHRQFKYVIVWKLDRFARNRYDSAIYKHKLKKNNVKLLSATQPISDNPEGVFLEAMLEANAEYYSLELSQKVRRGNRESKLKGNYTGGHIPYGYKVTDKKFYPDEVRAPIVKYVFEEYAAGRARKRIIDELNAKGLKLSSGKPFSQTAFAYMLKNEKYTGKYIYDGQALDEYYPEIISEELFNKVQARLNKNKHANQTKKVKHEYLLSGKINCGHCGGAMLGDNGTSRNGDAYLYYTCGERKRHRNCDKKSEKKDFIEWYVVEQTIKYALDKKRIEYIAGRIVEEYDREFGQQTIFELERKLRIAEDELGRATGAYINASPVVRRRLEERIEQLDATVQDINIDLAKMRVASGIKYTKKEIIDWLKLFTSGDLMDMEFRKRIIDVFINCVYVYDDRLVIYFNIKDGKQISYIDVIDSMDELDEKGTKSTAKPSKAVRMSLRNDHHS